jgi:nucleotide-binding universal stress UspA family protein
MLVPFDGSHAAEQLLRRACRAAQADQSDLIVLGVVRIPTGVALDELPDDLDDTVLQALIQAQEICRQEDVAATFELTHARYLPDAILEEAQRSEASLICLSLDEHVIGETALMSPEVQSVLAAASCSVLLNDPGIELPPPAGF